MSEAAAGAPAVVGALPSGASPWTLARRRLLRNRVAIAMLGVFVAIVLACLAAPHLRTRRRAHRSVPLEPERHDDRERQAGPGRGGVDQRARPRHDADRPDVGSAPLLPRRRRAGTRRRGAAPLRRAQLAADRVLRGADHVPGRHGDRHRRRFLRRRFRRGHLESCSRWSGRFPSTCSRSASRRSS